MDDDTLHSVLIFLDILISLELLRTLYELRTRTTANTGEDTAPAPTLSRVQFNDLDILRRDGIDLKNDECSICLERFDSHEYLKVLPCHHGFHQPCLKDWFLKYNATCPLCRAPANGLRTEGEDIV
jgi:hypothetical protein